MSKGEKTEWCKTDSREQTDCHRLTFTPVSMPVVDTLKSR